MKEFCFQTDPCFLPQVFAIAIWLVVVTRSDPIPLTGGVSIQVKIATPGTSTAGVAVANPEPRRSGTGARVVGAAVLRCWAAARAAGPDRRPRRRGRWRLRAVY